ncbi:hypothetical protein [Schleiferia thermophila]|uniref:Uncharacterized protein n=1 Tax=Schleiferia thermophila TaxID=884107 RepID=A0A369AAR7_9FLAO|nr:hypothetical protein [Schleiferia thermophila]RCX05396.1 hypothetical protein DES35_101681 [Schleiferia thermophila]GCD79098.1 hypothetical protein JCM30197_03450 [Schleiferia thermophila]
MSTPKFLIADNTDFPDDIFVIHTEYPRFILNMYTDELEWLDDVDLGEEDDIPAEIMQLLEQADEFYDREMGRYENFDAQ